MVERGKSGSGRGEHPEGGLFPKTFTRRVSWVKRGGSAEELSATEDEIRKGRVEAARTVEEDQNQRQERDLPLVKALKRKKRVVVRETDKGSKDRLVDLPEPPEWYMRHPSLSDGYYH